MLHLSISPIIYSLNNQSAYNSNTLNSNTAIPIVRPVEKKAVDSSFPRAAPKPQSFATQSQFNGSTAIPKSLHLNIPQPSKASIEQPGFNICRNPDLIVHN